MSLFDTRNVGILKTTQALGGPNWGAMLTKICTSWHLQALAVQVAMEHPLVAKVFRIKMGIFGYVSLLGVQIGKCMTFKHILTRNRKHIGKQRAMISKTKSPCHSLERLYDPTTNVLLHFCCTFMSRHLPYINFL